MAQYTTFYRVNIKFNNKKIRRINSLFFWTLGWAKVKQPFKDNKRYRTSQGLASPPEKPTTEPKEEEDPCTEETDMENGFKTLQISDYNNEF